MEIDCGIIDENVCVRVLEMGNDVEYWAGHYGTRFKGETVALIVKDGPKNWIAGVEVRAVMLESSFTTFFNKGEGQRWYNIGTPMQ